MGKHVFEVELTNEQEAKLNAFRDEQRLKNAGAIGGQFTWCFTHTSLGVVVKVVSCLDDKKGGKAAVDLTDYKKW